MTVQGFTCQRWDADTPWFTSTFNAPDASDGTLDNNYCRNPDDDVGGIWCYTTETDPKDAWDFCNPIDLCNCQLDDIDITNVPSVIDPTIVDGNN